MKKQKYVLVYPSLNGEMLLSSSFFTLGEALATWSHISEDIYPRDVAQVLNVEEGTVMRLEYGMEEENMVEA
jgi:hypothetical protein